MRVDPNDVYMYIQARHIRRTPHTKSIVNIFITTQSLLDAKSIHQTLVSQNTPIDLSTIHRILEKLLDIDLIVPVYQDKVTCYELSSQFLPHHHHFTCVVCKKVIDIDSCIMNDSIKSLSSIGKPIHHSFEVQGICNQCNI